MSTLDACHEAANLLKVAGFELRAASRVSEACYYALPGRIALLRVASHSARTPRHLRERVVSRLTFTGTCQTEDTHMRLHPEKHSQMVEAAIGRYMIRSARM